jgi:hypothetical protein
VLDVAFEAMFAWRCSLATVWYVSSVEGSRRDLSRWSLVWLQGWTTDTSPAFVRTLCPVLASALAVSLVLFAPPVFACMCTPPSLVPQFSVEDGATIPSNAPSIGFGPNVANSIEVTRRQGRDWFLQSFHYQSHLVHDFGAGRSLRWGGFVWVQPDPPWIEGATYRVKARSNDDIHITIGPAVPPPTTAALTVGPLERVRVDLPGRANCTASTDVARRIVRMDLPEGWEAYRDVLAYATWVDDRRWRPLRSTCASEKLGTSRLGKGLDGVFAICDRRFVDEDPSPSVRNVTMYAFLPGTALQVSASADLEFHCGGTPPRDETAANSRGGEIVAPSPEPVSVPSRARPSASAIPAGGGCAACSLTMANPSWRWSVGWLAGALAWMLRRRGGGDGKAAAARVQAVAKLAAVVGFAACGAPPITTPPAPAAPVDCDALVARNRMAEAAACWINRGADIRLEIGEPFSPSARWTPDGKRLVLARRSGLTVVDRDGEIRHLLDTPTSGRVDLQVVEHRVAASVGGTLHLWDLDEPAPVARWSPVDVDSFLLSESGHHVAWLDGGPDVHLWTRGRSAVLPKLNLQRLEGGEWTETDQDGRSPSIRELELAAAEDVLLAHFRGGLGLWWLSGPHASPEGLYRRADRHMVHALDREGRWLAFLAAEVGADHDALVVIDRRSRKRFVVDPGDCQPAYLAFHPSAPWLASVSHGGELCVFSLAERRLVHTIQHPTTAHHQRGGADALFFTPKGRYLYAEVQYEGALFAVDDWRLKLPAAPDDEVWAIAPTLFALEEGGRHRVLDVADERVLRHDMVELNSWTTQMGQSENLLVRRRDQPSRRSIIGLTNSSNEVGFEVREDEAVVPSPDGQRVAVHGTGRTRLLDASTGDVLFEARGRRASAVQALATTLDGSELLIKSEHALRRHDRETMRTHARLWLPSDTAYPVPDGRVIEPRRGSWTTVPWNGPAAPVRGFPWFSADGTWALLSGSLVAAEAPNESVRLGGDVAAFDPRGHHVVVAGDRGVAVLALKRGLERSELTNHDVHATRFAFDARGDRLAIAHGAGEVELWNFVDRRLLTRLESIARPSAMVLDGAGRRIALARGRRVEVLDVDDEAGRHSWTHSDDITALAFASSNELVVGDRGGSVTRVDLPTGERTMRIFPSDLTDGMVALDSAGRPVQLDDGAEARQMLRCRVGATRVVPLEVCLAHRGAPLAVKVR